MKLISLLLVLVVVATAAGGSSSYSPGYAYGTHHGGYGTHHFGYGAHHGYGRPQISSISRLHPYRIHVSPFHTSRADLSPSYVTGVRVVRPFGVVNTYGYGHGHHYGYGNNAGYYY